MKLYKITATYIESGQELLADRHYALGEYAYRTWDDKEEAEAVANELRADVGTVVDESVIYTVEEAEVVTIGEWGHHDGTAGHIVCSEFDEDAVRKAYDDIEEGDMGPDVLDSVYAAGGRYEPERQ